MGNKTSNQAFEFPEYLETMDNQQANNGYYRLRDKRNSNICIGKTIRSNGSDSVDDIENLIRQKLDNPSPYVTQLIDYTKNQKETYCSSQTVFYLLFKAPQKTLADQIIDRSKNKRSFTVNEVDNMIQKAAHGLKYLYNSNHIHGKVDTQAIEWGENNNDIKIVDRWAMNNEDTIPHKACNYTKKSKNLGEKEQQHATDLYDLGMIGMNLIGNYNPKYDSSNQLLIRNPGSQNQQRVRQKLEVLCDRDEERRFEIYKILENSKQTNFNNFVPYPNVNSKPNFYESTHNVNGFSSARHNPHQNFIPVNRAPYIINHGNQTPRQNPIFPAYNQTPRAQVAYNQFPQNPTPTSKNQQFHNVFNRPRNISFNNQQITYPNFNKKGNGIIEITSNKSIEKATKNKLPTNKSMIIPSSHSISVSPKKDNSSSKPLVNFGKTDKSFISATKTNIGTSYQKNNNTNLRDFQANKSQLISFSHSQTPQFVNSSLNSFSSFSNSNSHPSNFQQTPTFHDLMNPVINQSKTSFQTNSNSITTSFNQSWKITQKTQNQTTENLRNIKDIGEGSQKEKNKISTEIQEPEKGFESPNKINNQPENHHITGSKQKYTSPNVEQKGSNQSDTNVKKTPIHHMFTTIPERSQSANSVGDEDRQYVLEEYQNGSRYQGYKSNNMRNGKGKFYYQEGSFYDGQWKNNNMHGYGKLYYSNKKIAYEGQWYMDQFHGKGKVYNDEPQLLKGSFDYSNFENLDEQWEYYEGTLVSDSKEGYGKLVLSNGQIYEGQFHNDNVHGKGKFYTDSGQIIEGIWNDSKLQKRL